VEWSGDAAAEIAVYGMQNGFSDNAYTFQMAHATDDFFYNARQTVNGFVEADVYKTYANTYLEILQTSQ